MARVKKEKLPRTWAGKVITDEVAEELADEIESDREVRWARRRPVGKSSLDGDGFTPKVSFRMPAGLCEELQLRANKERRTVSELTCEALAKFLTD
jgi:hypothetical protein